VFCFLGKWFLGQNPNSFRGFRTWNWILHQFGPPGISQLLGPGPGCPTAAGGGGRLPRGHTAVVVSFPLEKKRKPWGEKPQKKTVYGLSEAPRVGPRRIGGPPRFSANSPQVFFYFFFKRKKTQKKTPGPATNRGLRAPRRPPPCAFFSRGRFFFDFYSGGGGEALEKKRGFTPPGLYGGQGALRFFFGARGGVGGP